MPRLISTYASELRLTDTTSIYEASTSSTTGNTLHELVPVRGRPYLYTSVIVLRKSPALSSGCLAFPQVAHCRVVWRQMLRLRP